MGLFVGQWTRDRLLGGLKYKIIYIFAKSTTETNDKENYSRKKNIQGSKN